jgi:signal transduction histidine kinase
MVAIAVINTDRLVRLIDDILDIERMAAGRLSLAPATVDAGCRTSLAGPSHS